MAASSAQSVRDPRPREESRPRSSRRLVFWLGFLAALALLGWGARRAADNHLRAVSVLVRLSKPGAQGFLTRFARHPFKEEAGVADTPQGPLKFRMYVPLDVAHPPGIVLLHGIHKAGIDEPRLINFGRTLATAGIEVMTPELQDLADYRVSPRTVDTIGQAAAVLCAKMNQQKVGVVGVSFAGGLALLAADRPEYSDKIGFVLAVGAHDSMARVAHFFAANMIERPDGSEVAFQAHEYGVLVLAYSHIEDFFSPKDAPIAREALRKWLWEQASDSMQTAQALSPAGRLELDTILHHRDQLQPALFQEIKRHSDEMDSVSPHNHVGDLRVPVYLLHGTTDSVIPASETLWLAKEVPPPELKAALISPAMNLIHVDKERGVPLSEEWALVDFMAKVLKAADMLGHAPSPATAAKPQ